MPRIFVSYRRKDSAGHAGRLFDRLRDHFGAASVFRDIDRLKGGDDFVEALARAVDSSDVFVLVIGRDWLEARNERGQRRLDDPQDFIRLEVETALRRKVLVLPVLVEGTAMPEPAELPEALSALARRQAIELSEHRWDFDVQELLRRIDETGGGGRRWKRVALWAGAGAVVLALSGAATSRIWRPLWLNATQPPATSTSSTLSAAAQPSGPSPTTEAPVKPAVQSPPMQSPPPSQSPSTHSGQAQSAPTDTPAKPRAPVSTSSRTASPETHVEPPSEKRSSTESRETADAEPAGKDAPPAKPGANLPVSPPVTAPVQPPVNEPPATMSPPVKAPDAIPPVKDAGPPPKPPSGNPPPSAPVDARVRVPDLSGQPARDAAAAIRDIGLHAKLESHSTGRSAPGTIYGQRPPAGTPVDRDSVINLYVATALNANEHAAGTVFLSPGRMIDLDEDKEGAGWDVSLDRADGQIFLSFGRGVEVALLPMTAPGARPSLDPAMCERVRYSALRLPVSERMNGQQVCVRTSAGRTSAILIGRLTPDPLELFVRYSTLEAARTAPDASIPSPAAPARPTLDPRRLSQPVMSCEQAVQGRIAWDYSGNTSWPDRNVARLCRGAVDDQPARCFDHVMRGGVDWGGGTQWQPEFALDLCAGTKSADATIACFQRYIRARRPMREAIQACGERGRLAERR